jgi:SAM-dependent methyltransferase
MEELMNVPNREQTEHWNNPDDVGHWITEQTRHDEMLEPFIDVLTNGAQLAAGDDVLDVGCGCGATTLAAARIAAPGTVVGIDLSAPMLDQGRCDAHAAGLNDVAFQQGDAQTHRFDTDTFDAVISRFGIMFFDDPVAAFTNIRTGARRGARLAFVCWQPLVANEWLLVPGAALAQHVPLPDLGGPDAPGMFAFGDPQRGEQVLRDAGWRDMSAADIHTPIYVGGHGTVDDAVTFLRTGSMGRTMLADIDRDAEARALEDVRAALAPHHDGKGVRLDAAVWLITAEAN